MPEVLLSRLLVAKAGLYPIACFLSAKTCGARNYFRKVLASSL